MKKFLFKAAIPVLLAFLMLTSCNNAVENSSALSEDEKSAEISAEESETSTESKEEKIMDYTLRNLVKNLSYEIETGVDISTSYANLNRGTLAYKGLLTDGEYAKSSNYSDEAYHVFYRGLSRSIIFDLGEEKQISGFKINFLQHTAAGVDISDYVDLYVSDDGENYKLAHKYDLTDELYNPAVGTVTAEADFAPVKGRYVKIKFRVAVNVYVDEIEVFGCDVKGNERELEVYTEKFSDSYEAPVEGHKDMVLLYCGYNDTYDLSFVQNTEEEMMYYFGYIDQDGNIKDTMFDSFMFNALRNVLPSGRKCTVGGDAPLKSDWEYYIDSIFDEVYNCGAIEKAVEKVKKATGKENYTVSLVINMPYPNISNSQSIGDFDGDGKDEYCKTEADQVRLFAWFMDACMAKFEERGYKNIKLAGFYWEDESIQVDRTVSIVSLIKKVADICHERNKEFFWIPLLYANGFDYARELGFDSITMQPNLSFYDYSPSMMKAFSETCKKYNMGVEMEIHWNAVTDRSYRNKFYTYLDAGVKYGYMENASHTYYQNSNPGTFYTCAKSSVPAVRKIYDDLYKFIKHSYEG